eukprot:TRINITY_DN16832_c0_g1_i1.p1 TRINITY_DN16832_c0_g1~~TRINITY_DN16832_c0_g1_i1.p1  ORF type:complete len:256 (+),score=78.61 TRINITY_DN16832_c0_g1_i1:14-781(+)
MKNILKTYLKQPFNNLKIFINENQQDLKKVNTTCWRFLKYFGCVYFVNEYIVSPINLIGPSMLPTFNLAGDIVLVNKLPKRYDTIIRGDVVALRSPTNAKENLCKRVLAMEGDTIYNQYNNQVILIPPGHIWIQGDNPANSTDSRHYGPIPYNLLIGKVVFRVVPFYELKFVENDKRYLERIAIPTFDVDTVSEDPKNFLRSLDEFDGREDFLNKKEEKDTLDTVVNEFFGNTENEINNKIINVDENNESVKKEN